MLRRDIDFGTTSDQSHKLWGPQHTYGDHWKHYFTHFDA